MYRFECNEVMKSDESFMSADLFSKKVVGTKVALISKFLGEIEEELISNGLRKTRYKNDYANMIRRSLHDFEDVEFDCLELYVNDKSDDQHIMPTLWLGSEIVWDLTESDSYGPASYEYEELNIRKRYFRTEDQVTIEIDDNNSMLMEIGKGFADTNCRFKLKDINTDLFSDASRLIYDISNDDTRTNLVTTLKEAILISIKMYKSMRSM